MYSFSAGTACKTARRLDFLLRTIGGEEGVNLLPAASRSHFRHYETLQKKKKN